MALDYTEHTWGYGEEFTPDKLNNMEHGIKAASDAVNEVNNNLTPIKNALSSDYMTLNSDSDLNDIRGFHNFWWTDSVPKNAPDNIMYSTGISFGDYFTVQIIFEHGGSMYYRVCEGDVSYTSWRKI